MSDITELMSRDPFKYQKADLDGIIAHVREQRAKFSQTSIAPKTGVKVTTKQRDIAALVGNLDITL